MRKLLVALVALLSCELACPQKSSSGSAAPQPSTTASAVSEAPSARASATARIPTSIVASKKIRVGSDISSPPLESYTPGTTEVAGFEVDLCNAIAAKLGDGITCDFQNDDFDKLLDDLGAGKFDIVMSAMSDHIGRQAKADLIDYFRAGMSVIIKKGNPLKLESLRDLCGKTIGAQKGTDEESFANSQRVSCTNAGRAALTVVTAKTDADGIAMLKAGKLAADLEDYPAAQHTVRTSGDGGDFELLGEPTGRNYYGIAVAKDNTGLRDAIVAALKELMADKTYGKLVQKWNLSAGALAAVEVNGGG
jgi:polar amino acid transport system substrate-binding protein